MRLAAKSAAMAAIMALGLAACGGEPEPDPEEIDMSTRDGAIQALESMGNGSANASGPMKVYVDGMDDIAEAITKVNDESSARRAAQDIAKVARDMEDLQEQFENMSDQEKTAMAMANMGAITQSGSRVAAAMLTLQSEHPELVQIISDEMDKMPDMN